MPSSLAGAWALYPNPGRTAGAAFADRPGVGVVQADQPGGAVGHLPGQPGPGLGHERGGPADGDRQLAQRPPQPPADPPAEGTPDRAAAVAQHRGRLRRSSFGQIGQVPSRAADRPAGLVPAPAVLAG
jgi:hypothetical protein